MTIVLNPTAVEVVKFLFAFTLGVSCAAIFMMYLTTKF